MSDEPHNPAPSEPPDDDQTVQGQIRHHQVSAIVPESVGPGVLSNGVMILSGQFEIVLDFVMRLGEQQRISSRVILPHAVGRQFVAALQDNIISYERRFGALPTIPRPLPDPPETDVPTERPASGDASSSAAQESRESSPLAPDATPEIDDIYRELKMPDRMLSGRYANAVLIRHSATEFCFDFITNVYPRSAVNSRVFLATPHVAPFLKSLSMSILPPEPPPFPFLPPLA